MACAVLAPDMTCVYHIRVYLLGTSVYVALGVLVLKSIALMRSEPVHAFACVETREMWQWCANTLQPADTECDSSSSDTDTDQPYPLPLAWEAPEVPRDLASDLVPIAMVHVRLPKTIQECTPAGLLPAALRKDSPELNFQAPVKRRRITGKQDSLQDLGRILRQLKQDPTSSLLPWQANWMQRRQAYHGYELDSSEAMGCSQKRIFMKTMAVSLLCRGGWRQSSQ